MNELGKVQKELRIAGKCLLVSLALLDVAYPKETPALLESVRIQAKIPSGIFFLLLQTGLILCVFEQLLGSVTA